MDPPTSVQDSIQKGQLMFQASCQARRTQQPQLRCESSCEHRLYECEDHPRIFLAHSERRVGGGQRAEDHNGSLSNVSPQIKSKARFVNINQMISQGAMKQGSAKQKEVPRRVNMQSFLGGRQKFHHWVQCQNLTPTSKRRPRVSNLKPLI